MLNYQTYGRNRSRFSRQNRRRNDNLEQQASSILSDWASTYPCRAYKLSDICKYVSAKCDTGNLTSQNYISTENMLPNKKGIVDASNIPTGKVTCFKVDDILIANIRPYFQKIWKADISGGCSTDVLCIRSYVESHSPILYWILHQDAFFEYVMTGAKGCKMPRGDKQHIMNWTIDLPEPEYWADIATQLGAVDQRLAYNRVESINLSNLRDTLLPKLMSGELKINEIDC
jgi:type I restriction enzyme S subunit